MRKSEGEEKLTHGVAIYSSMNIHFLRELAEKINLSFRSHADTEKETLVKLLDKKFSPEKADTVFKMYLTCFDAEEVAKAVRPKGMEEIVVAVKKFFKTSHANCIYEVTVGSRRCDVVCFVGDSIIAVEVKSSQDHIKNAEKQLVDYSTWANQVFLAYDVKHKKSVAKLNSRTNGIGLLEFDDENIQLVENAVFEERDSLCLLSLMTYTHLKKIARVHNVDRNGKKQELAKRLSREISSHEVKSLFNDFLKMRALR